METVGNGWMWIAFFVLVVGLLLVDLLVLKGGKNHKVSLKEAATWSLIWIAVALLFNLGIWYYLDANLGRELANQKSVSYTHLTLPTIA